MREILALAVLLWATQSLTQPSAFITYSPRDGLVNARVTGAYQDSQGCIYFMTYGGLSVYDGVRFRNYTMRDGLAADLVNDVLEIGIDSILIATNASTLNLLSSNTISAFPIQGPIPVVNHFLKDDKGDIYLSTDDGLFLMQGNRVNKFHLPLLEQEMKPYLGRICDAGPYLIFGTNDLRENRGLYLVEKLNGHLLDSLPEARVYLLTRDAKGRIWTTDHGKLFLIDPNALQEGRLLLTGQFEKPEFRNDIFTAVSDVKGSWWLKWNRQLTYISEEQEQIQLLVPEFYGNIFKMFLDREHILWICTDGSGVLKVNKPAFHIHHPREGPSSNAVVSHSATPPGHIWYNTKDGHLYARNGSGIQKDPRKLPPNGIVFDVLDEKLYATDGTRVFVSGLDNDRNAGFQFLFQLESPLLWPKLLIDPNGVFVSHEKDGLKVYRDGQKVFTHQIGGSQNIEAIQVDGDSLVWLTLRTPHIIKFRIAPQHNTYLTIEDTLMLPEEYISCRSMFIDNDHRIWVGTRYHGIFVYDVKDRPLTLVNRFDMTSGMTDNFISALVQSPDGSMVAGTQTGIDRITFTRDGNYLVENLTKASNYFAFIKSLTVIASGQVYAFTNTDAEIEIYPPDTRRSYNFPQLMINEIKVNGTVVHPSISSFTYNENNLSLSLAAPTFIDEKQVKFSYFLEGSTRKEWSEASHENATIHFANLRPSEYTVHLRAFFPSTTYPPAELHYHFIIRSPWWLTTYARIGMIAIALLISWAVIRFITRRKLERQQAALDKQQAIQEERTRISGDLHDDLGAGLSSIRFLAERMRQSKDQIPKEEIERIQSTSDALTDKMNEIIWAMSEQHDTLDDLISYTRSYAATYCDEHDLTCHIQLPDLIPTHFVSGRIRRHIFLCVKEVLHNIVKHANAKNVFVHIAIDDFLNISIRDDGRGMMENGAGPSGHGLPNLQRRINELKGTISFQNVSGVTVQFTIPLLKAANTV